ncbi:hypothetical protein [Streptomyces boninensis]|uniref:hypothetical protein n=1 Tax=Streptomyces boninensis TaxID=2039455 RepID=UPI003B2260D0
MSAQGSDRDGKSPQAKQQRADEVYDLTQKVATAGMWAEGLSGVVGFGLPVLVDAGMIGVYSDMWNDIRGVYGKGKITAHAAQEYIKRNIRFLIQDFVWDTVLGNVPVAGAFFNVVFAKATTWRLGIWFGALAALGEEDEKVLNSDVSMATATIVRELFPELGSPFDFKTPDREIFTSLLVGLDGLTTKDAKGRLDDAMKALRGELRS